MKTTRRNTHISKGNESDIVERSEQVDIHRVKLWAKVNLPVISHLREILLLEEDLLSVDEFLAKIDIWIKLIELEGHSLN
jgi:hypothetical protein